MQQNWLAVYYLNVVAYRSYFPCIILENAVCKLIPWIVFKIYLILDVVVNINHKISIKFICTFNFLILSHYKLIFFTFFKIAVTHSLLIFTTVQ